MNRVWMTLCLAGAVGCMGGETDDGRDSTEASAVLTRPSLSSICGRVCRNSHSVLSCTDQRPNAGEVNVSTIPLIEGASKGTAIPGVTTADWSSTSCPNCQWSLVSVIDSDTGAAAPTSLYSVASAAVNGHRFTLGESHLVVNMQIYDPTDASVGVCDQHVLLNLYVGTPL